MRNFSFVTVGMILDSLEKKGLKISRPTFYKLEKQGVFPTGIKSKGGWRTFSKDHAKQIENAIWKNFFGKDLYGENN